MTENDLDIFAARLAAGLLRLGASGFILSQNFGPGLTPAQVTARARFAACELLGAQDSAYDTSPVVVVADALLRAAVLKQGDLKQLARSAAAHPEQPWSVDNVTHAVFADVRLAVVAGTVEEESPCGRFYLVCLKEPLL